MAKLKLVERENSGAAPAGPLKQAFHPHRLEAPYAYYTDDGTLKAWGQHQVLTDHDEIQHLKDRGARLIELKP